MTDKIVVQITLEVPTVRTDLAKEMHRTAIREAVEKGFTPLQKGFGIYLKQIIMQRNPSEEASNDPGDHQARPQ